MLNKITKKNRNYKFGDNILRGLFISVLFTFPIQAELNYHTSSVHPLLSPASANGARVLITTAKVIFDKYQEGGSYSDPANATKALDGNAGTSTGRIAHLSVDLGDNYVVDSIAFDFARPSKYNMAFSSYYGPDAPFVASGTTGIDSFPQAKEIYRDFHPILWVQDPTSLDGHAITPSVGRFVWFHFHYTNPANADIKELKFFGHKYTPSAGDLASLARGKWSATGTSCKNCGEGDISYHLWDELLPGVWNLAVNIGENVILDMGDTASFTQVSLVMTSPSEMELYASNDKNNWGPVFSTFHCNDSITINFPQKKQARYLKFSEKNQTSDWWDFYDINVIGPLSGVATGLSRSVINHPEKQIKNQFQNENGWIIPPVVEGGNGVSKNILGRRLEKWIRIKTE